MKAINYLFLTVLISFTWSLGAETAQYQRSQKNGWVKDQKGCLHSDDFYKPHGLGKITWTGKCKNGKASGYGEMRHIKNGNVSFKYIGTKKQGYASGKGKIMWSDGDIYIGSLKKGDKHGKGSYFFSVESIKKSCKSKLCVKKFIGEYKKNKRAYGKITYYGTDDFYIGGFDEKGRRLGKTENEIKSYNQRYTVLLGLSKIFGGGGSSSSGSSSTSSYSSSHTARTANGVKSISSRERDGNSYSYFIQCYPSGYGKIIGLPDPHQTNNQGTISYCANNINGKGTKCWGWVSLDKTWSIRNAAEFMCK